MSDGRRGDSDPKRNKRPPHPATVAQPRAAFGRVPPRPPHLATVAQPRAAFGRVPPRPPHPATVAQPRSSSATRPVVQRMEDHSDVDLRTYEQNIDGLIDGSLGYTSVSRVTKSTGFEQFDFDGTTYHVNWKNMSEVGNKRIYHVTKEDDGKHHYFFSLGEGIEDATPPQRSTSRRNHDHRFSDLPGPVRQFLRLAFHTPLTASKALDWQEGQDENVRLLAQDLMRCGDYTWEEALAEARRGIHRTD